MIELIVSLLVLLLILYIVNLVLDQIAIPQAAKTIVWLIIAVVVVVWLLQRFGMLAGL